jgi:hypothetical protein
MVTALSVAPDPPMSELAYLQSARQRVRRVLLACRYAIEGPRIEDPRLDAAIRLLSAGATIARRPLSRPSKR